METSTPIAQEIDIMRGHLSDLRDNIANYGIYLNTLETIWDAIPAMFFFKDVNNNIIKVNDYFCKVTGVKKEEVEGRSIKSLMKNQKRAAKYAENDIEVMRTGEPKLSIYEKIFDSEIKIRTDKFPIIVNGEVKGVLGFSVILK